MSGEARKAWMRIVSLWCSAYGDAASNQSADVLELKKTSQ